jgi:hypothetical protein
MPMNDFGGDAAYCSIDSAVPSRIAGVEACRVDLCVDGRIGQWLSDVTSPLSRSGRSRTCRSAKLLRYRVSLLVRRALQ